MNANLGKNLGPNDFEQMKKGSAKLRQETWPRLTAPGTLIGWQNPEMPRGGFARVGEAPKPNRTRCGTATADIFTPPFHAVPGSRTRRRSPPHSLNGVGVVGTRVGVGIGGVLLFPAISTGRLGARALRETTEAEGGEWRSSQRGTTDPIATF